MGTPRSIASATRSSRCRRREYLASSYYERWLWAIEHLAAEQGLLDSADRPAAGVAAVAGDADMGGTVPAR